MAPDVADRARVEFVAPAADAYAQRAGELGLEVGDSASDFAAGTMSSRLSTLLRFTALRAASELPAGESRLETAQQLEQSFFSHHHTLSLSRFSTTFDID